MLDVLMWNSVSWVFPLRRQWQCMHTFGEVLIFHAVTNLAAYWAVVFWQKVIMSQKMSIGFTLHEICIKWLENCSGSSVHGMRMNARLFGLHQAKPRIQCQSVILILALYRSTEVTYENALVRGKAQVSVFVFESLGDYEAELRGTTRINLKDLC